MFARVSIRSPMSTIVSVAVDTGSIGDAPGGSAVGRLAPVELGA